MLKSFQEEAKSTKLDEINFYRTIPTNFHMDIPKSALLDKIYPESQQD